MPGLYRSPGMADIDVCFGKRQAGTEALRRTSQRHQKENEALEELKQRPRRSVTMPQTTAYQEEDENDVEDTRDIWAEEGRRYEEETRVERERSNESMHEGYGERREEETGLPPTPPEGLNSDEPTEPQPLFADGVRNALSSQKSGALSTTPVNPQLSPPTPDTTPPARPQDDESAIRRQRSSEAASPEPLDDQRENSQPTRPQLQTFETARETLPICEAEGDDQVYLPENDRLPEHWLEDTTNKPDLNGAEDKAVEADDLQASHTADDFNRSISPTPPRSRYRFESPQIEREETDWEKHISYVSGPDELDLSDANGTAPEMQEDKSASLAGLGVSGIEMGQRQRSAEDINNSVYRQIQQENIRRESAISTHSGAIRAGICFPSAESTPRSVRRKTKCSSLRDGPASEGGKRGSVDSAEHTLKHERRHLPARSTLQESPVLVRKRGHELTSPAADVRQVSSPARLGNGASKRATMTLAEKTGSAAEQVSKLERKQRLKRQSHGERLSKNMDVRRTSQEVSPADLEEAFNRIDRGAASVRRQRIPQHDRAKMHSIQTTRSQAPPMERQSQMNTGVKRSKVPAEELTRPPRLRNVIPSVTSEPETESPLSPRQVRRFSREERLENNQQLRRPSADQPEATEEEPGTQSAVARTSEEPSVLSSPRKSMDARYLHPTTTPMSTSGFSDRTADIEVCEASGVRIYPHNNNSLLVVQQGSRPASEDKQPSNADGPTLADIPSTAKPIFAAHIDPPTPVLGASNPCAHVDSPLTNPRAAPEPPSIQFIPPTPHEEIEAQLGDGFTGDGTLHGRVNLPGRNLSFKQKVRRYSDSFFGRGARMQRPLTPPRDTHLSPMWRPQRFWDDYDSEEDEEAYYDDYDYEPEADVLPPGGDTSSIPSADGDGGERKTRSKAFFPRAMSKRLPGFRGRGGFLQGNSLGIDRHGSNNRRHYVSMNQRTLSRQASEEWMRNMGLSPPPPAASGDDENVAAPTTARSRSMPPAGGAGGRANKGFKVPFTGGMRAKWVGTRALRVKMREARLAREEREREKRRERLKGRIGMRVYHG